MTTTTTAETLMDRLKAETRADHDATEAIPFSGAMVRETLPRERYVGKMMAYRVLHEALDTALATSDDPAIRAVWEDDLRKVDLIERDVAALGEDGSPATLAALDAAGTIARRIESIAQQRPVGLLGYLYVLEGSTLGGTILRKHLASMYGIDESTGLAYYTVYGNAVMPHWMQFKARMNEAVTDSADQAAVIAAAGEAFRGVGLVLQALSEGL